MMPSTLAFWINAIGYQVVWFAAIVGGGRGFWWPGVVAAALFILQHLTISHRIPSGRAIDMRLLAVALLIGVLLDGSLARSGLADYAGDTFALPSGGAPLWILALWASFALTLRHSMFVLIRRPSLAFAVGALFGPLAYLGAGRAWSAIVFTAPQWKPVLALSIGWGIALLTLSLLVRRWSPLQPVSNTEDARNAA